MKIPTRYLRYFDPVFIPYGRRKELVAWRCRVCEKDIKPTAAGAYSHLARHARRGYGELRRALWEFLHSTKD